MKTRRLSTLAAALAAALALGACGSDGESSDGADPAPAAGAAQAEPAALTADTFAQEIAKAQVEAGSAHLTMTVDAGGQTMTAEGDATLGDGPADTAVSMTMQTGETGEMDVVLVDEVFYMNLGALSDGKFVKIDLNDTSNPAGAQYRQLVGQVDPGAQLEELQAAMSDFEKAGEPKEIDGVQAQPYAITIDTAKMAEVAGEQATAGMPASIEYTMWIGPDNLLRRMESSTIGTVVVDYSKWGEDVTVEAPPASQVSDKDLFSSMS